MDKKLHTFENQPDIFYISSFKNKFTTSFCNHIINNYSVSKEVEFNNIKYVPHIDKTNNSEYENNVKPVIDFFDDTKYIKCLKYTLEHAFNMHIDRADSFFLSTKQLRYLNIHKRIENVLTKDRSGYNSCIRDINPKLDFELYSPSDICILPFSYDITEKDIIMKNIENIYIKRTDVYYGRVKCLIFLNTIEDGHLIIADRYVVPIVTGTIVLFPNSILFHYKLSVNHTKAYIITATIFGDFNVK